MLSILSLHQISSNRTGPLQRRAPFVNIWISSSTCITVGSPTIQFLGSEVRVWARTKMAKYGGNGKTWRCFFWRFPHLLKDMTKIGSWSLTRQHCLQLLSPWSLHNFFTESHNTWSLDDGIKSPVLGRRGALSAQLQAIRQSLMVFNTKKQDILYILLLDAIGMVCGRFALYFL